MFVLSAGLAAAAVLGACGTGEDLEELAPDGGVEDEMGDEMEDEPMEEDDPDDPEPPPFELEPGCSAVGELAGHPVWFFFTRPDDPCTGEPGSGRDRNILDELQRLIESVPPGGRIDGHIFSITVDRLARALLEAQERGVEVWLSTDRRVGQSMDSARTEFLDRLDNRVYCGSGGSGACISTADGAISHAKLFVFSEATTPEGELLPHVSWFGSANQTYASGMKLFNNTATVYGDQELYDNLRRFLDDMHRQRRRRDYYDAASGRGYLMASAAKVYASPEVETDIIVNRLNDVTPTPDCRVRVMQASMRDSRMAVVNQLVKMKRGGCKVWVVLHFIGDEARAALRSAGIPVRQHDVHDKSFIVYGKYGDDYRYRVYTGSHNLSHSAGHRYDEIFVKLAPETAGSHPVYDAFYTHFNDAYNNGDPL